MRGNFFLGGGAFEVREMQAGALSAHEVEVRNLAAGICGTDVHIYRGEKGCTEVSPPVVLGHEYAGVVTRVGDAVLAVKPGDHVAVDPNIYCGRCRPCRRGQKQFCENLTAIGVNLNGGFAEYSVAPEGQVFLLDPALPITAGAMAEPLSCCIHGVEQCGIGYGDCVLVVGGGAIGLLMLQLARLAGAGSVVLSEPVAFRREIGLSLGADAAFDPAAAPLSEQLRAVGLPAADVVIECVGIPAATAQAFEAAAKGARILLFSVPHPDAEFPLPLFQVFRKELKLLGSLINPDTFQKAVDLLNRGKIETAPLITHTYPLEQVEQAILRQVAPDSIKVLVLPHGGLPG